MSSTRWSSSIVGGSRQCVVPDAEGNFNNNSETNQINLKLKEKKKENGNKKKKKKKPKTKRIEEGGGYKNEIRNRGEPLSALVD